MVQKQTSPQARPTGPDATTTPPVAAVEPGPAPPLTPAQRKLLKARAHSLHPVVLIGDKGLTEAVLHELDVSLKSHELIKVRAADADREAREAMLQTICAQLSALPVQHIGKVLVVYRAQPEAVEASEDLHTPSGRRNSRSPARGGPARRRAPDERVRRLGRGPGSSAVRSPASTRARPRGRTG